MKKPTTLIKAMTVKDTQKRPSTGKSFVPSTPKMKLPTIPQHRERLAGITPTTTGKGKKS